MYHQYQKQIKNKSVFAIYHELCCIYKNNCKITLYGAKSKKREQVLKRQVKEKGVIYEQ
jgi:hypothetical protein